MLKQAMALMLATTSFGTPLAKNDKMKTCEKLIMSANKTDMRDEIRRLEKLGWRLKGEMVFKDYGFEQAMVKTSRDCDQ